MVRCKCGHLGHYHNSTLGCIFCSRTKSASKKPACKVFEPGEEPRHVVGIGGKVLGTLVENDPVREAAAAWMNGFDPAKLKRE